MAIFHVPKPKNWLNSSSESLNLGQKDSKISFESEQFVKKSVQQALKFAADPLYKPPCSARQPKPKLSTPQVLIPWNLTLPQTHKYRKTNLVSHVIPCWHWSLFSSIAAFQVIHSLKSENSKDYLCCFILHKFKDVDKIGFNFGRENICWSIKSSNEAENWHETDLCWLFTLCTELQGA